MILFRPVLTAAAFVAALAAAEPSVWAASGRVLDTNGNPMPGAQACVVVGGKLEGCATTDEAGFYRVPAGQQLSVRVWAPGFLPVLVAAVDQESPVVLRRAAKLLVRVVDADTGAKLSGGSVAVIDLSGRQKGGFPFNKAGVSIADLEPGQVLVVASLDGYDGPGERVDLEGAQQTEVTLRLRKTEKPRN